MGRRVERPYPLPSAPLIRRWLKHRREGFITFVDETFLRFFRDDQGDRYGYFSYGGFGLPVGQYDRFKQDIAPLFSRYQKLLSGSEKEFKHTDFKRIPYADRMDLAKGIARVIERYDGFVSGFYTPGEAIIMEQVRNLVMDDQEELPPDTSDLYQRAITDFRTTYEGGPGDSKLLATLLNLAVSAFTHMIASFGSPFRILYDSRERREDAAVKTTIDELQEIIPRLSPEVAGLFRGLKVAKDSKDELGIQIADLMAGETRDFFDANRELMSFGATRRIISQTSDEDIQAWDVLQPADHPPMPYKVGGMTRIPEGLRRRFFRNDPEQRSVMSAFSRVLAAGSLTCYSSTGQPRHVMPYIHWILDQSDR